MHGLFFYLFHHAWTVKQEEQTICCGFDYFYVIGWMLVQTQLINKVILEMDVGRLLGKLSK